MADRGGTVAQAVTLAAIVSFAAPGQSLPDTKPLELDEPAWDVMVAGIDRFLLRELERSVDLRKKLWRRDTTRSPKAFARRAYRKSVAGNRERLRKMIGAVDPRRPRPKIRFLSTPERSSLVGRSERFDVHAVSWPVLDGVTAEGLLLEPRPGYGPQLSVVAIPDADQTPEMLAGLVACPTHVQFARRLAESHCRVLIPTLISRGTQHSVMRAGRTTNQTHREFVYRPAFEMGRHIIGYEVQKVLAAIDCLEGWKGAPHETSVMGYGEGGLLALYSAALDHRVSVCLTSGYFDSRQDVWQEPIYRNVFGLLREFGDAEIASMIAPRTLIVEACEFPKIENVEPVRKGRPSGTAAPGRLVTPDIARVRNELFRAKDLSGGLLEHVIVASRGGIGPHGSERALAAFFKAHSHETLPPASAAPKQIWRVDPEKRQKRQLDELLEHTQRLMRESERVRARFFAKADRSSLDAWTKSIVRYRNHFYDEVIGRFDLPLSRPNPRTRKVYETDKLVGHEVMLDVFPDVIAYGILLVPKGIEEGERRPVVVCQHGLEGTPQMVADPKSDHRAYHRFAAKLAERGFVTYSPQNPYKGYDRFRTLQRKANPLKKTLFSIIVPQHQQTTDWLQTLPFVDPKRIAFYGLSYGGKTAMRVPPLVDDYCLSICSADFNDWIWKNVSLDNRYSYVQTIEYEIFEFDLGHTFNYAEMAALIAPRPFMVERGHRDGVAPDERVAYEYAKVRRLYADLKIPGATRIEFFDGPHTIHGVGTFEFLHRHLRWRR